MPHHHKHKMEDYDSDFFEIDVIDQGNNYIISKPTFDNFVIDDEIMALVNETIKTRDSDLIDPLDKDSYSIVMCRKIRGRKLDLNIPDFLRGEPGRGIVGKLVTYQISDSASSPLEDGEWTEDIPEVGFGEFLWYKVTFFYTDDTESYFYGCSPPGHTGDTGNGIEVVKKYDSIEEMEADFDNEEVPFNAFVLALIEIEDELVGHVFCKSEDGFVKVDYKVIRKNKYLWEEF